MLEEKYPIGINGKPAAIFRKHRKVVDIVRLSEQLDEIPDSFTDNGACSESCEFIEME